MDMEMRKVPATAGNQNPAIQAVTVSITLSQVKHCYANSQA